MIDMRLKTQNTIGTEGWMEGTLEPCSFVVIGDSKEGVDFGAIDNYFERIIAIGL